MTLEEQIKILGYDPNQPETEEDGVLNEARRRLRMRQRFSGTKAASLSSIPLPTDQKSDGSQPTSRPPTLGQM